MHNKANALGRQKAPLIPRSASWHWGFAALVPTFNYCYESEEIKS